MKQLVLILMPAYFQLPVESTKTDSGYRQTVRQENPCSLFLLHGDDRESGNRYRKRDWR